MGLQGQGYVVRVDQRVVRVVRTESCGRTPESGTGHSLGGLTGDGWRSLPRTGVPFGVVEGVSETFL